MTIAKAKPGFRKCLRVRPILRALGLPFTSRWPTAAERIKGFLVEARRIGDDDTAKRLSEMKDFLRRNLPTNCQGCGAVISAGGINCKLCARHS